MATAHLSDERLRQLVAYSCEARLFRVCDVVDALDIKQGNFSSWKNGNYRHRYGNTGLVRGYVDRFFAQRPLPAPFARAPLAVAPPAQVASTTTPITTPIIAPARRPRDAPPVPAPTAVRLAVATWNVKNLGAATPQSRRTRIASMLVCYDLVALQEIRALDVRAIFASEAFGCVQCAPSGTSARRESTCFVYRRSRLRLLEAVLVHEGIEAVYAPARATFEILGADGGGGGSSSSSAGDAGQRLTVLSVHVSASLGPLAHASELRAVGRHAQRLLAARPAEELLVLGDFNAEPSERAFRSWSHTYGLRNGQPALASTSVGRTPHMYDHIWARAASRHVHWESARVVDYSDMLDMRSGASRTAFRHEVSDHLPVTLTLAFECTTAEDEDATEDGDA